MERAGIGDDDTHASETKPQQLPPLLVKIGQGVFFIQPPSLEEAVELGVGRQAEYAPQVGMSKPASTVLLGRESL